MQGVVTPGSPFNWRFPRRISGELKDWKCLLVAPPTCHSKERGEYGQEWRRMRGKSPRTGDSQYNKIIFSLLSKIVLVRTFSTWTKECSGRGRIKVFTGPIDVLNGVEREREVRVRTAVLRNEIIGQNDTPPKNVRLPWIRIVTALPVFLLSH